MSYNLPILSCKDVLIKMIKFNHSLIIIGETGSGKTTQIPKFVFEFMKNHENNFKIAVTQPRRIAAISLAQRVAHEMNVKLGNEVGYCIRFEDISSNETVIKYVTDGMLLRESLYDPTLSSYKLIILDEAHERTVHTDMLFGIILKAQKSRLDSSNPLKVIIMSATIDADLFSNFFKAKVAYVEGRQHNVKIMYTLENATDYFESTLVTILQIHRTENVGNDILAFLTGQEEIYSMVKLLRNICKTMKDVPKALIFPLFAALPSNNQLDIFKVTPPGFRKIIISTNIAETSITLPGITNVVDCGMVKLKIFDSVTGGESLQIYPVSKSQARQRAGRAGRICPGVCYRLYTEKTYDTLLEDTIPEIKRRNLAGVLLQLIALGIDDVYQFNWLEKPSDQSIDDALMQLISLNAIDRESKTLTEIGSKLVEFPLEPNYALCLIYSMKYNCFEQLSAIIALLSEENKILLNSNNENQNQMIDNRKKFVAIEGDHIRLYNIWKAFRAADNQKNSTDLNKWAKEHFLNLGSLKSALKTKRQLSNMCSRLQEVSSDKPISSNESVIKALIGGLFRNTAQLSDSNSGEYTIIDPNNKSKPIRVFIHPSSCLFKRRPYSNYIIFSEMIITTKTYIRQVSVAKSEWLTQICSNYFQNHRFLLSDSNNSVVYDSNF